MDVQHQVEHRLYMHWTPCLTSDITHLSTNMKAQSSYRQTLLSQLKFLGCKHVDNQVLYCECKSVWLILIPSHLSFGEMVMSHADWALKGHQMIAKMSSISNYTDSLSLGWFYKKQVLCSCNKTSQDWLQEKMNGKSQQWNLALKQKSCDIQESNEKDVIKRGKGTDRKFGKTGFETNSAILSLNTGHHLTQISL